MSHSFFQPPETGDYTLRNVTAPRCLVEGGPPGACDLVALDIAIERGRIGAIAPAGALPPGSGPDLDASMVLPGMVDLHTHLDKGHIWPRQPNLTGDVAGASKATMADRTARWHAQDVECRM